MADFFNFLNTHRGGIIVFLLSLAFIIVLVNWLAWIFSVGRFKTPQPARGQNLRYVLTEAAVKIINDFRHLLALIIVLIFGFALAYAMLRAGADIDTLKEALQAVVATLGGLVGSIIGYYFGESTVTRMREAEPPGAPPGGGPPPEVQPEPPTPSREVTPITPVQPPPTGATGSEERS